MKSQSYTLSKLDLKEFVATLLETIKKEARDGAFVIALHGDLGAGKTTLVQTIGEALGITGSITSPTYIIMKQYDTEDERFTSLIHMDAYRIETIAELKPLRFKEMLAAQNTLFCIEWAERVASVLPPHTLTINLTISSEDTRTVQVSHS